MTPREFILHWHTAARLASPRIVPHGWERQALLLMEQGITAEDLSLVAKWMLAQLARSQAGERNSVSFNAASFRWGKMFGEFGGAERGDEFARFAELLSAAEAARKPACMAAARPAQTTTPPMNEAQWQRAAAAIKVAKESLARDLEGGLR